MSCFLLTPLDHGFLSVGVSHPSVVRSLYRECDLWLAQCVRPFTYEIQLANGRIPSLQKRAVLNGQLEKGSEGLIVVSEDEVSEVSAYPWPNGVERTAHGETGSNNQGLFGLAMYGLKKARPDFEWIPLFKDARTGQNAICRLPDLMAVFEQMFLDQLKSKFSVAQRSLLHEADCILAGFHRASRSIASYGSVRFSMRGSIPGVQSHVTHGGVFVVDAEHQAKQITPMTASVLSLYGHSFRSLFRNEIIVVRINNKYVERILRRAEPVYRSDQIVAAKTPEERLAMTVMAWTHEHVFHMGEQPLTFGKPIPIEHWFEPNVRMEGLRGHEIVYAVRMSSLAYFLFKVFTNNTRKRSTR